MIEVSKLSKTYRMGEIDVPALNGVSLKIEPGDFVAIMGPSGSGKSTLLHVLGLLDLPDSGSYRLNGQEVAGLKEDDLANLRAREIGFVFQQFNLLARTSALENVGLPLIYRSDVTDPSRPAKLLEDVGLADRIHHKPSELSGGQQQRVAIARALVNDPHLILADEPTGNLDSKSEAEILALLKRLNDQGMTVVMVTHEGEVAALAKRTIRMKDGRIESDVRREKMEVPKHVPKHFKEPPVPTYKPTVSRFKTREITQHFKQAFRALMANKVRSGLSLLGILIGVAALIAMLALGRGAKDSIEKQLSSLGTNLLSLRPGSARTGGIALEAGAVTRLTLEDATGITAEIPSVRRAAPQVNGRAQAVYGAHNWNTRILGTTSDYAEMRAAKPTFGRFFIDGEDRRRERLAVIGMTVARNLFGDENPLGETILVNRISFQVIGLLPEKGSTGFRDEDDVIIVPLQTAMRRLLGKDYVDSIDIEVANSADLGTAQDAIEEMVRRRHRLPPDDDQSFQVRNMADIQEALSATSRVLSNLLAAIAAISLLVGGIGIMNIMLVSVAERTREIGLRKAVGARAADILGQFLVESSVVSLMGGVIGIILGWAISILMAFWGGWVVTVTGTSILLAVFFSGGVGVLFGMWPARRASQLNPIEALRYE